MGAISTSSQCSVWLEHLRHERRTEKEASQRPVSVSCTDHSVQYLFRNAPWMFDARGQSRPHTGASGRPQSGASAASYDSRLNTARSRSSPLLRSAGTTLGEPEDWGARKAKDGIPMWVNQLPRWKNSAFVTNQ